MRLKTAKIARSFRVMWSECVPVGETDGKHVVGRDGVPCGIRVIEVAAVECFHRRGTPTLVEEGQATLEFVPSVLRWYSAGAPPVFRRCSAGVPLVFRWRSAVVPPARRGGQCDSDRSSLCRPPDSSSGSAAEAWSHTVHS